MTNLIHPLGDNSLDFSVLSTEMRNYLRELNHHFGLFVYSNRVLSKNEPKLNMVSATGHYYGHAFIKEDNYVFASPYISKSRARGGSKTTRESTSLSRLIKSLKDDLKKFDPTPLYVRRLGERIDYLIERTLNLNTHTSTHWSELMRDSVLNHLFNKTPIPQMAMEMLEDAEKQRQKAEANKITLRDEMAKFDRCYVLYGTIDSPVLFGIAETDGEKFTFQGEVKPCGSLEDLPTEFLVPYKMWRISAVENKEYQKLRGLDEEYVTPLHGELIRTDKYFSDCEVLTCYDNHTEGVGTEMLIVIPCPEATQNAN